MFERLYFVIEIVSLFYIVSYILNKRFETDVLTVTGISVNIILMELINEQLLLKPFVLACYVSIFLCFYIKYKKGVVKTMVAVFTALIIQGVLQLILVVPGYYLIKTDETRRAVLVNALAFAVVLIFTQSFILNRILNMWKKMKNDGMVLLAALTAVAVVINIISVKITGGAFVVELITLSILMISASMFSFFLAREHSKLVMEKEERKIDEMYSGAFKTMISEIRNRQHGFDNHINAMAGICYSSDSVEEIRKNMSEYTEFAKRSNRTNKLLREDASPVLTGFIFGKTECISESVEIESRVMIGEAECKIARFTLIEIIGVLFDNAYEAEQSLGEKDGKIIFEMTESETDVKIIVKNRSPFVKQEEMSRFFKEGYSTKGENRGLGLYGIKKLVEKKGGYIIAENVDVDGSNYVEMTVNVPK